MPRNHLKRIWCVVAIAASLVMAVGCADSELTSEQAAPAPLAELPGNTGKADGISYSIKDYFTATNTLPIDDLTDRLAKIATDGLNSGLARIPYVDIKLSETQLFGLEAGTEGGSTVTDLNSLVSGLSSEYGETGFVTRLNQTRQSFLTNSTYTYFAESEFKLSLNGDTSFSTEAGDVSVRVGFNPSIQLKARTVFAHEGNFGAVLTNPLLAASEARGFILPRDTDDLRNLLPGESIQLSGDGVLAFNFGANLPIFSASPIDHLVLTARFHLGARIRTSGDIDIQYIRGDGDDLFIDVGIRNANERRFRVAFERGLGLEGIPPLIEVALGDRVYKLGEIAESLVESRLNRSSLLDFGVTAASGRSNERMSLQRFRVSLNTNTRALDQAIKQIGGGDLRLMQTLADRADSGVTEVLSLERGMKEKYRHLGAHIASMRFFSERTERDGKFVVRNGDQVEEVLFRELDERSGRFWTDWGFRRQVLTSQTWEGGRYVGATSNLRLAVTEADSFTKRDQVLDHVDTALLTVLDFETAYVNLTRQYEELQHEVDVHCDDCDDHEDPGCDRAYRRCVDERITDQEVEEWRQRLNQGTDHVMQSLEPQGYQSAFTSREDIARQLLGLKLHLSSVKEIPSALADVTGRTSILSDFRVTQAGLDGMFRNVTPEDFDLRMREMLTMIVSKRNRDYDRKYDRALSWLDGQDSKIRDMVEVYRRARDRYVRIDDSSRIGIGGGRLGDGAFIIGNWGEEESHTPAMLTIAEQKSLIAADMVEDLVDEGSRLSLIQALVRIVTLGLADTRGFESHHLASYTIASLVEPQHREWLINMDFEEPVFSDVRVYSRGAEEDGFISAGEFDLERLTSE